MNTNLYQGCEHKKDVKMITSYWHVDVSLTENTLCLL